MLHITNTDITKQIHSNDLSPQWYYNSNNDQTTSEHNNSFSKHSTSPHVSNCKCDECDNTSESESILNGHSMHEYIASHVSVMNVIIYCHRKVTLPNTVQVDMSPNHKWPPRLWCIVIKSYVLPQLIQFPHPQSTTITLPRHLKLKSWNQSQSWGRMEEHWSKLSI